MFVPTHYTFASYNPEAFLMPSPLPSENAAFMDPVVAPEVELVACPLDIFLPLMSIVRVNYCYIFSKMTL